MEPAVSYWAKMIPLLRTSILFRPLIPLFGGDAGHRPRVRNVYSKPRLLP
jgi:hypothetical protein